MKTLLLETANNLNILVEKHGHFFYHSQDNISSNALEKEIKNIQETLQLLRSNKKEIYGNVITRVHGDWTRASLHRAASKLSKAQKSLTKLNSSTNALEKNIQVQSLKENLNFAALSAQHGAGIMGKQYIFKNIKAGESSQYLIASGDLEIGDVILSYKTSEYLRKDILANLIAYSSRTHVTHSSVVCDKNATGIFLITSKPEKKGLAVVSLEAKEGEILIVLKPTANELSMGKILHSVESWKRKAQFPLSLRNKNTHYYFSEFKSWVACFLGLIYSQGIHITKKGVILPNPFSSTQGIFCSELVDTLFKEAGIFLVPRSEYDSIVGPIEILYSPQLSFRGLIGSRKDLTVLENEIASI